jgi:hypothetical protein
MKCFRVEGHHDLTPLRTSILFTWMPLTHFRVHEGEDSSQISSLVQDVGVYSIP